MDFRRLERTKKKGWERVARFLHWKDGCPRVRCTNKQLFPLVADKHHHRQIPYPYSSRPVALKLTAYTSAVSLFLPRFSPLSFLAFLRRGLPVLPPLCFPLFFPLRANFHRAPFTGSLRIRVFTKQLELYRIVGWRNCQPPGIREARTTDSSSSYQHVCISNPLLHHRVITDDFIYFSTSSLGTLAQIEFR